ncbi:hypothetical protein MUG84_16175 [Paenibacillus sp. KQZ6P-2]|uniref:Uncharacterized protein n=1 Tax=Paenibacillus mangrovi TaxID=2931978 RepID=A0A9X1WQL4_9BACL|nr:hypothetical protein [Paenibacillus mangrovi]MCJ8013269.1 hypothetical protein [Paenibacillus mangrovi]
MTSRKWCIVLVAVLLVTNGVTLGLLIQSSHSNDKLLESGKAWEAFTLNGMGQNWQVNDYKMIRTASSIYRGNGSLTYLGDPQNIEKSTYFSYTFYEKQAGKPRPVLSHTESSVNGPVAILENVKHLGSIQGAPSDWELEETSQDLGNSYVEIKWKDNLSKLHMENIPLSVTEEYSSME